MQLSLIRSMGNLVTGQCSRAPSFSCAQETLATSPGTISINDPLLAWVGFPHTDRSVCIPGSLRGAWAVPTGGFPLSRTRGSGRRPCIDPRVDRSCICGLLDRGYLRLGCVSAANRKARASILDDKTQPAGSRDAFERIDELFSALLGRSGMSVRLLSPEESFACECE